MTRVSTNASCGTTARQTVSQGGGNNIINGSIVVATDGNIDYTKGQAQYVGTARCDPARDGTEAPKCCGES